MALVTCPDCGTQYDQITAHCPNCGRPNPLRQPGATSGPESPRDTPPGGAHAGGGATGGAGGAYSGGNAYSGGSAGGQGGGFSGGTGGGFSGGAAGGGGAYGGGPAGGAQYGGARPEIPNYLVFAIFLTLCCCAPLAIPALINAARVDARRDLGDYDGAWAASREAKKWCFIALAVGLGLYVVMMLAQGAFMAAMMSIAESQGVPMEGM